MLHFFLDLRDGVVARSQSSQVHASTINLWSARCKRPSRRTPEYLVINFMYKQTKLENQLLNLMTKYSCTF